MTPQDGHDTPRKNDRDDQTARSADPLHRIPLIGRFMRSADELRHQIPLIGEHLTRTDADVLRFEARMLRMIANRMEGRAQELDRIARQEQPATPTRIKVE